MKANGHRLLAILDFGSQYTRLIARRARELKVLSRIFPWNVGADELAALEPGGVILSGGPSSVLDEDAPMPDKALLDLPCPVLGVCYGMQALARLLGLPVERGRAGEYGRAGLQVTAVDPLFGSVPGTSTVWMSHGDRLLPADGVKVLARTDDCPAAAVLFEGTNARGIQFHPEVSHSEHGREILASFLFDVCSFEGDWLVEDMVDGLVDGVRSRVGEGHVLVGLSGGVDSAVTAALCGRALGDRAHAVFVDNGLLRKNEREEVEEAFSSIGMDLRVVDGAKLFLDALAEIEDPERKRRIIGRLFIEVFEKEAAALGDIRFLAQGTLYPDVIESSHPEGGPSATIKTHHNVGGLPDDLKFELVEPLRDFFKDEVRLLGRRLGLPARLVERHPFPGPGLAVRILGAVDEEKLEILRAADAVLLEEIRRAGWYGRLFQAFAVLLPRGSVGVMGDGRTHQHVVAVRAVESTDAMTADWARLPHDLLDRISTRICNEVEGVNRVVYDFTSKPPATIEWE